MVDGIKVKLQRPVRHNTVMGKLLPARWKTVLLVVLAGLVTLYLLLPRVPALVRRGRDAGPWQGYQDCSPADRVAFVFKEDIENSDFFNLHNVIARYAFNNNLGSFQIICDCCTDTFPFP